MVCVENSTGKKLKMVTFTYAGAPGHTVELAGAFNDWNPDKNPMKFNSETNSYSCTLELAPGDHEYKFIVDGEWIIDDSNPNFASNDFGTLNSIISVQ